MKSEVNKKLSDLIKNINKRAGNEICAVGIPELSVDRIPFTSPTLAYCLYGGLPRDRIVEFAGMPASGKTSSALDVVGNAQKLFISEWNEKLEKAKASNNTSEYNKLLDEGYKKVVYLDAENTLNAPWARTLGVDDDDLILIKPTSETAEELFQMLLDFISTGAIGLIVIDSIGMLMSQQAYEKTVGERTYGGIAMALTIFCKKAQGLCTQHNCCIVGINQMRADLNSQFGGYTTTGGVAWNHSCSVRLRFSKGDFIDEKGGRVNKSYDNPSGNMVKVAVEKTKICRSDRKNGTYTLNYLEGIDYVSDTIELCVKMELGNIVQQGAWYVIKNANGEQIEKVQGKSKLHNLLSTNEDLFNEVYNTLMDAITDQKKDLKNVDKELASELPDTYNGLPDSLKTQQSVDVKSFLDDMENLEEDLS